MIWIFQETEKTRAAAVAEIDRQKSELINVRTDMDRQVKQLKAELDMSKRQMTQLGKQ